MRSTVLVSRIVRVIETDGAVGDGAALAVEYDRAVRQVNARLEEVHAAVEAKQMSDAVRIMEMEPRIIEEMSILMFRQLQEWKMMCARCRWQQPTSLDKSLFERVMLLSESREIVEPFLRMYRKAVMTNNHALALQSLRRLSAIDKSQDWSESLAQTEEIVLRNMVDAFRSAKEKGDADAMQKIAQEFGDSTWTGNAKVQGIVEIRAFLAEKAASQRNAVGAEDVEILRKCAQGEWKRSLVFSILQSLDGVIEQGWQVPEKDAGVVDECRRRCAAEMEAEEREAKWKDASSTLAAAVTARNAAGIREALQSQIFRGRPPEETLLNDAKAVLVAVAKAKRRKRMVVAVCILVVMVALFAVAAVFLRAWLTAQRCDAEIARLEAVSKKPHAIERLQVALAGIRENDPDVYEDERVKHFEGVLSELRAAALVRTNELAKIEADLTSLEAAQWDGVTDADVSPKFERADEIMTSDDGAFGVRFKELQTSFLRHRDEAEQMNHAKAVDGVENIRKSVERWNVVGEMVESNAAPLQEIERWRTLYAAHEHELSRELDKLETLVKARIARDAQMRGALAEFDAKYGCNKVQCDAAEIIEARERLISVYGGYSVVSRFGALDASANDVKEFLSKVEAAGDDAAGVISDAAFRSFLNNSVLSMKEAPSYYSLYGLLLPRENAWRASDAPKAYYAISTGRPLIKRLGGRYVVDGNIFKPSGMSISKSITLNMLVESEELATSQEIKGIVSAVRPNMSVAEFEGVLLKAIGRHLKAANEKGFLKKETPEIPAPFSQGRYPAIRRIQMINLYFSWLRDDMNVMPSCGPLANWVGKVESLAQNVLIDGVPDDMTWLCMEEKRICDRNEKCAKLLVEMAKSDILKTYRLYRRAQIALGRVMRWKVECVGAVPLACDKPQLADAPHYVMRRTATGGVAPLPVTADLALVAGEPIYVVKEPDGKPIDVQATLKSVKQSVPEPAWNALAPRSPFVKSVNPVNPANPVNDVSKKDRPR